MLPQRWCLGWQHFLRLFRPALDFTLVCLLKKLMGFKRKSVWKLLNLVGFLSVSLSVLPFVWVLKKTLDASRQVDVIIVGFKVIFVMLLQ